MAVQRIEYSLVDLHEGKRSREPLLDRYPLWIVYAGSHGGILVYKPELTRWEQLKQTPGKYWKVTLPDFAAPREDGLLPRFDFKVHQLVLLAWEGEPQAGEGIGRHLNGDPHDNRRDNLCWGSRSDNAKDANEHAAMRAEEMKALVNHTVALSCDGTDWICVLSIDKKFVSETKGPNYASLIESAIYPVTSQWFHEGRIFETDGSLVSNDIPLPRGARAIEAFRWEKALKYSSYSAPLRFVMTHDVDG